MRRISVDRAALLSGTALGVIATLIMQKPVLAADPAPTTLPTGGVVASGNATISQSGARMDVNQSSQRAIVNWQTFSIGRDAHVNFNQPSADAAILNRVTTQSVSQVLGKMTANGKVYILNPSGIVIGNGAQVNVGSLVASTMKLSDSDFMAGRDRFERDGSTGAIVNRGTVTAADGGAIALLAPELVNEGVLAARMGKVVLAAGETVTLDLAERVSVQVSPATIRTLVDNKAMVVAEGGQVVLTAKALDTIVASGINLSGKIEAGSLTSRGGEVVLESTGPVMVSGSIDARGTTGGTVIATGDRVGLLDGSSIDASGRTGAGGTILVGGDYLGGRNADGKLVTQDVKTASRVAMTAGARIRADGAIDGGTGDGGKVVLWSDEVTRFAGSISARGGAGSSAGGFVETSSKDILEANGEVSTGAEGGTSGLWLLDPRNVTIAGATANGTFSGGTPDIFTPNGDDATVNVATINTALSNGTSVTISTGGAGNGTQDGDITVNSAISKTGGGAATLTLEAARNIVIEEGISSNVGQLAIVLNARAFDDPTTGTAAGSIRINTGSPGTGLTINSNGGAITMAGGTGNTGYAVGGALSAAKDSGIQISSATVQSGGGNIVMRGQGAANAVGEQHGIGISGSSTINSGTGTITMTGLARATGGNFSGGINIFDDGTAPTITSASTSASAISLTGTNSGSGGNFNWGVNIQGGTSITATGAGGGISLTGTGGSSGASSFGVAFDSFTNVVSTTSGAIAINGTSNVAGTAGIGGLTTSTSRVGTAGTTTGAITFTADSMMLTPFANGINTTGTVTLRTNTAGRAIVLGSTTDNAAALELSDAEIDKINAGTLRIGQSNGAITINSAISPAGTSTLALDAGTSKFVNNVGGGAISMGSGRFLIYSNYPGTDTRGGLSGATRYSSSFDANPPSSVSESGNFFLVRSPSTQQVPDSGSLTIQVQPLAPVITPIIRNPLVLTDTSINLPSITSQVTSTTNPSLNSITISSSSAPTSSGTSSGMTTTRTVNFARATDRLTVAPENQTAAPPAPPRNPIETKYNFAVSDVIGGTPSLTQLRSRGATVAELIQARIPLSTPALQNAGYSLPQIVQGGFPMSQIAASVGPENLKTIGMSPIQFKFAGVNATELLKSYTLTELRGGGYSAADLARSGASTSALVSAGFTYAELLNSGVLTAASIGPSLKNSGLTVAQMKALNIPLSAMLQAGLPAKDYLQAGYRLTEIAQALSLNSQTNLKTWTQTNNVTALDLFNGGLTPADMLRQGLSLVDLIKGGISYTQLTTIGIMNIATAKNLGVKADELRAINAPAQVLLNAGYTVSDLSKAGYPYADLRAAKVSLTEAAKYYTHAQLYQGGATLSDLNSLGVKDVASLLRVPVPFADLQKANLVTLSSIKTLSVSAMLGAGVTIKQMLDNGLTVPKLLAGGVTAEQIRTAGYAIARNGKDGVTLGAAVARGVKISELLQMGFTKAQIKYGVSVKDQLALGTSMDTMLDLGYSLSEMHTGGMKYSQLVGPSGAFVQKLMDQGVTVKQMLAEGVTVRQIMGGLPSNKYSVELRNAGVSAGALLEAGFNVRDASLFGFTGKQLAAAGYTLQDMIRGGISPELMFDAGHSIRELVSSGVTVQQLRFGGATPFALASNGVPLAALKAGGFTAYELGMAYYTAKDLKDVGFTIQQLKEASFSPKNLKDAGYTTQQLKDAGFTYSQLGDAGYTAKDLLNVGASLDDLRKAGFSIGEVKSAIFGSALDIFEGAGDMAIMKAGYVPPDPNAPSGPFDGLLSGLLKNLATGNFIGLATSFSQGLLDYYLGPNSSGAQLFKSGVDLYERMQTYTDPAGAAQGKLTDSLWDEKGVNDLVGLPN
jgi:filamentous hemagglutinin family protein